MTEYSFNPKLPILHPNWKGNKKVAGRFVLEPAVPPMPFGEIFKWKMKKNPQAEEKRLDTIRPELVQDENLFDTQEDCVVWMGHASFFIRIKGINLLIDPVYYDLPGIKRQVGIPCKIENIRNLDYILLSHDHRDHFDEKTLCKILAQNPKAEVLMPLNMTGLFRKLSLGHKVQEAGWWQQYHTPETIKISFLPAKHWCRRWLTDFNRILWGSFMIEAGGETIYFAGDTAYDSHFQEIASFFPNIDLVLMPIGAYMPVQIMKNAHINPEEAVQAFADLGAKRLIPMHYGAYDLSDEPMSEPPRRLAKAAQPGSFYIPKVGERVKVAETIEQNISNQM